MLDNMFLSRTNIEERLQVLRARQRKEQEILEEVKSILFKDADHQTKVRKELDQKARVTANNFDFDLLETHQIYHLHQIKQICIDYRLRFLDSGYFKGEIPQSAISKIKRLETLHNIKIKGFKIMAPSKLFKLEDKDDPLLFAPIGNNYFYLVHKWGNDLHPIEKTIGLAISRVLSTSPCSCPIDKLFGNRIDGARWAFFQK